MTNKRTIFSSVEEAAITMSIQAILSLKKQKNHEVAQDYKRQLPSQDFLDLDCSRQTYAKYLMFLRPRF